MKNLSLVSSTQIHIDINNNRKQIYKFATMLLYRSQQQPPCVTPCFIITNILLLLYKTYETGVFWSLDSVQVIPRIWTCNNETNGSEALTAQYELAANVGSTPNGTVSINQLALMIFPDMGKEGKEHKEIT
jgi:hypothetical protein